MNRLTIHLILVAMFAAPLAVAQEPSPGRLSVVAIGDAGEKGGILRGNAAVLRRMQEERHSAGTFDAMFFLGDNFYDTGLNVPAKKVEGVVKDILGPFEETMRGLGPARVHAIAGNHDYYARNAVEFSTFLGLVDVSEGPVGLTERGIERERAIPFWTMHAKMPAAVRMPIGPGAADSVEFVLYDSALPLRTQPSSWLPALDSLRSLLAASAGRPGAAWRVLVLHHPLVSVGEHGGYSVWDDVRREVTFLTPCDRDSNAVGWIKNLLDPEDLCAERYRAQVDSLREVVRSSGLRFHLALSGHDHSLQLLVDTAGARAAPGWPPVQIVSGAGAKVTRVRPPAPPAVFTSFPPGGGDEGRARPGFVRLDFTASSCRAVFYGPSDGDPLDMGMGWSGFMISPSGTVEREEPPR